MYFDTSILDEFLSKIKATVRASNIKDKNAMIKGLEKEYKVLYSIANNINSNKKLSNKFEAVDLRSFRSFIEDISNKTIKAIEEEAADEINQEKGLFSVGCKAKDVLKENIMHFSDKLDTIMRNPQEYDYSLDVIHTVEPKIIYHDVNKSVVDPTLGTIKMPQSYKTGDAAMNNIFKIQNIKRILDGIDALVPEQNDIRNEQTKRICESIIGCLGEKLSGIIVSMKDNEGKKDEELIGDYTISEDEYDNITRTLTLYTVDLRKELDTYEVYRKSFSGGVPKKYMTSFNKIFNILDKLKEISRSFVKKPKSKINIYHIIIMIVLIIIVILLIISVVKLFNKSSFISKKY